jgi:hypothetical protein
MADFDEVYSTPLMGQPPVALVPGDPPVFVGSYVPVTPAGHQGAFLTNTYFLQDSRKYELRGPTTNRSSSC